MGGRELQRWTFLALLVLACGGETRAEPPELDGSGGSGGSLASDGSGGTGGVERATANANDGAVSSTTRAASSNGGESPASDVGPAAGAGGSGGAATTTNTGGTPGTGGDANVAGTGGTAGGSSSAGGGAGGTGSSEISEGLDLYLMVDRTASMDNSDDLGSGLTRWESLVGGVGLLLEEPGLDDVGVAFEFYSYTSEADCTVELYSDPLVPMAPLPSAAESIKTALDQAYPLGLTPTYPALDGAIRYAKSWKGAHPTRAVAVVFITDGYPTECEPLDLASMVELAEDSWETAPSIPVHVIGIDGILNLNQIADAGGTGEAIVVDSGDAGDTRLAAALLSVVAQYVDP